MNLKLKAIEISNYDFKRGDNQYHMPILKIACVLDNEEQSEIITGYLSPFRGYRFQVSATHDGNMDLGSSSVVGLANLKIDNWGRETPTALTASNCSLIGITKEILKGLMSNAIIDFLGYPHIGYKRAVKSELVSEDETLVIDASTVRDVTRSNLFKLYIDMVYDYLWNENNTQEEH